MYALTFAGVVVTVKVTLSTDEDWDTEEGGGKLVVLEGSDVGSDVGSAGGSGADSGGAVGGLSGSGSSDAAACCSD